MDDPKQKKAAKAPATKPVSIRLSGELLGAVDAYRATFEFPPSLSAVIEKALKDFLATKKGKSK